MQPPSEAKIEVRTNWLERAIAAVAPAWGLRRYRARAAAEIMRRHYEGAAAGRRTQGWNRSSGDANAVTRSGIARLRDVARDLVRNNGHAESAIETIAGHTVGWGIVAKPKKPNPKLLAAWKAWAETTACDADGRHDLAGLQDLVMRTVVEAGECLVRRRRRRLEDGLPFPLQLQVLEPDFIDTSKTGTRYVENAEGRMVAAGRIISGIEFDALGRRTGYWLFPEHPGAEIYQAGQSQFVSAENVLHVYRTKRPGQARGVSWFAPVLLKFKDWDEYDDAQLMKQKIAACLAVLTTDTSGNAPPVGKEDDEDPVIDSLEPGMVLNLPPGRDIEVVTPPTVGDYPAYSEISLRAIAAGLGVTYEDLTGDYTNMPFSAARMSRLRHWARVEHWRWQMLVPQFCIPVWDWAMEAAAVLGLAAADELPAAEWTAPPMPMIEPDKEGLAYARNVRAGIMSLQEALRERGYDPETVLEEIAETNKMLDDLGLVLDSDPRRVTQQGQAQKATGSTTTEAAPETATDTASDAP